MVSMFSLSFNSSKGIFFISLVWFSSPKLRKTVTFKYTGKVMSPVILPRYEILNNHSPLSLEVIKNSSKPKPCCFSFKILLGSAFLV